MISEKRLACPPNHDDVITFDFAELDRKFGPGPLEIYLREIGREDLINHRE